MSFFVGTKRGKVPAFITAFPAVQQKKKGDQKATNCQALTMESRVFITNIYYKYMPQIS